MAKILTDYELKDIIRRAIDDSEIDESGAYKHFLEDLGDLIANHFGGERGTVEFTQDFEDKDGVKGAYTIAFKLNENVPDNGGVYSEYDTDVVWVNGEEIEADRCDCGKCKKNFMHNCSGSSNMTEIYGCPECDDHCGFCD